jgi:RNA polymerase sigma-70 factor, ECF subfamily
MQRAQLKQTAMRLTRDHREAEDLLQETVYKAFAKRDTFTAGTSLQAWLYTIIRNTFLSDKKREKIRQRIMDPSGLPGQLSPLARTEN